MKYMKMTTPKMKKKKNEIRMEGDIILIKLIIKMILVIKLIDVYL